jgi:hypothetical protein
LVGGMQALFSGSFLRVLQRIEPPLRPVTVTLRVRSEQPVELHLEVCEKHLLYSGSCLIKHIGVAPTGDKWHAVQAQLDGPEVSRGAWYAPRFVAFAIADATRSTLIELDDLKLYGADGRNLLTNGEFSQEMSRWFFSSERNHLPWHLKNIFVHTLFEQGLCGLALLLAMLFGALWRLVWGNARDHRLAPSIAAAIIGFTTVGLFDSLLDVPRVAFIFYVLLLLGLSLRGKGVNGPPRLAEPAP